MKMLTVVSSFLVLLLLSLTAQATQIQASYNVNANSGDGLIISTTDVALNPFSLDLMEGESQTFDLFNISTSEGTVNGDDQTPKPISVDFAFLMPELFNGSVDGSTQGHSLFFGAIQYGEVSWNGPQDFFFGNLGDGHIRVSLSDEKFDGGIGALGNVGGAATVQATLSLVQDATVPEPGMMLLLGLALLGVGIAVRRRQSADIV